MTSKPLLSILIPTHNRQDLLAETLRSVFDQSEGLEQVEILVSNDASKDDTREFLEKIKQEKAIQVFHHEKNLGGPGNWRFLLEKASGEFVYLLSDDDTIKPDFLKSYFSILKKHPEVDLIYCATAYCDDTMNLLSESHLSSVFGRVSGVERLKNQLIANHMVMSSVYRREVFLKAGGWQEKYGTCLDGGAFAMMCTHSQWTYFIDQALFCFRLGLQTWSSYRVEKQKKQYQSFRLILDDVMDWAKKNDSENSDFYKKCYSAHAQGVLNMLDLKMVHGQLKKSELKQLLTDLCEVFPETRQLVSFYKMTLVSYFGIEWLEVVRKILGKKSLYGSSVFEKGFTPKGDKQWV